MSIVTISHKWPEVAIYMFKSVKQSQNIEMIWRIITFKLLKCSTSQALKIQVEKFKEPSNSSLIYLYLPNFFRYVWIYS